MQGVAWSVMSLCLPCDVGIYSDGATVGVGNGHGKNGYDDYTPIMLF